MKGGGGINVGRLGGTKGGTMGGAMGGTKQSVIP